MAYIANFVCIKCGKPKQEAAASGTYPNVCASCNSEEKNKKEREWKAGREGLTIEERIKDLEHFMYHHGEHYKGPLQF